MENLGSNESSQKSFQVPLNEIEGSLHDAKIGVPNDMLEATSDMLDMLEDSNSVNSYDSMVALTEEFNEFMKLMYSDYNNRPDEWDADGIDPPSVLASYLSFVLYLNARRVIEAGSDFKDKEKAVVLLVDIEKHYKWFIKSSKGSRKKSSKRSGKKLTYRKIPLSGKKSGGAKEKKESKEIDIDRLKLKIASAVNQFAKEVTDSSSIIFERQRFLGKHLIDGNVDLDNPAFFMLSRLSSKMAKILTLVVNSKNISGLDDFSFVVDIGGEKTEISWQAGVGISREDLFSVFQNSMNSNFAGSKAFNTVLFGFLYQSSARNALKKFRKAKKAIDKMAGGKDDKNVEGSKDSDGDADKDVAGTENGDEEKDPNKLYLSEQELSQLDPLLRFNPSLDGNESEWKPSSFAEIKKHNIHDFLHTKLKGFGGVDIPNDFHLDPFQEMFLELVHHNVFTPMLEVIQVSNYGLKDRKIIAPTLMGTLDNIGNIAANSVTLEGSKLLLKLSQHILSFIFTLQELPRGGHMIETYCAMGLLLETISGYDCIDEKLKDNPVIGPVYRALRIKREAIHLGFDFGKDLMGVETQEGINWDELTKAYDKMGGAVLELHTLYKRNPSEAAKMRGETNPENLKDLSIVMRLLDELKKTPGLNTNDKLMVTFCMRTLGLMKDDHELANFIEPLRPIISDLIETYPDVIADEFGLRTDTVERVPTSLLMNVVLPVRPGLERDVPSMVYTAFFDSLEQTVLHFKDKMPRPEFLAAYMITVNLRRLLRSKDKQDEFVELGCQLVSAITSSYEARDYVLTNVENNLEMKTAELLEHPRMFWAKLYLQAHSTAQAEIEDII
jgi:hypothetical protein